MSTIKWSKEYIIVKTFIDMYNELPSDMSLDDDEVFCSKWLKAQESQVLKRSQTEKMESLLKSVPPC